MLKPIVVGIYDMPCDRNHDFVGRRHLLITVGHIDAGYGEVGVGIGELLGGKTHVCGACIGARGICSSIVREEGSLVQRRACLHVVAARGVLGSVVGVDSRMSDYTHIHFERRYAQATVLDLERHIEVGVGIGKLAGGKTHGIRAGIDGCHCSVSVEGHVILPVQLAIGRKRISFGCLGATRVDRLGHGPCNGDFHLGGIDPQATVCHLERDVLEIGIGVLEVFGGKAHGEGAGIRRLHGCVTREREVHSAFGGIRTVKRVVRGGLKSAGCMLQTIVDKRLGIASDVDDDSIGHGRNHESAIGQPQLDFHVRAVGVLEITFHKAHRIGAGVDARSLCVIGSHARDQVGFDVERGVARFHRIAADHMLRAIVRDVEHGACDGDNRLLLGYGQASVDHLEDDVVVLVGVGELRGGSVRTERAFCQAHMIDAHIRTRCRRISICCKLEIGFAVGTGGAFDGNIVTTDGMYRTVIDNLPCMSLDVHGRRCTRNFH